MNRLLRRIYKVGKGKVSRRMLDSYAGEVESFCDPIAYRGITNKRLLKDLLGYASVAGLNQ